MVSKRDKNVKIEQRNAKSEQQNKWQKRIKNMRIKYKVGWAI